MISQTTIERVQELSILDVVSHFVDLKKAGGNYRGFSPFTDERTPSFYVVPAKNIFKCFSSGKGGGAIKFVMEKEGKSYPEAIELICNKCGISVEYDQNGHDPAYYDEIEMLYKINQATARRYYECILDLDGTHPAFVELINKRRFDADTILQWEIGYAPGDVSGGYKPNVWRFLTETIVSKGLYKHGVELGLVQTKDNVNYDTFRHRVIFPIIDHNGRYVAFGGRALQADEYNPKYINSSESRIFDKSKVLFGLYFASQSIRNKGYAILVEGYTDVISFHQAGYTNAIAPCGTALTDHQCRLIKRFTNKVLMILDPDPAGQTAMLRNVDLLLTHGIQSNAVPLPVLLAGKHSDNQWRDYAIIQEKSEAGIKARYHDRDSGLSDVELNSIDTMQYIDPDDLIKLF